MDLHDLRLRQVVLYLKAWFGLEVFATGLGKKDRAADRERRKSNLGVTGETKRSGTLVKSVLTVIVMVLIDHCSSKAPGRAGRTSGQRRVFTCRLTRSSDLIVMYPKRLVTSKVFCLGIYILQQLLLHHSPASGSHRARYVITFLPQ